MDYRRTRLVIVFCVLIVVQLRAAVIFQDDFSNPGISHLGWVSANSFNLIEFTDGACKISDTSSTYSSHVYHVLATKPSVFTFSCTIKRTDATVRTGVAVCYSTSGSTNYSFLLGDKFIYILKPGETTSLGIPCPNLNDQINKITVSKSVDTFNVFINDRFITKITGTNVVNGDIAFVNYPKTSVFFDDVVLTDVFMDGALPTCYSDSFDDPGLTYWNKDLNRGTALVETGKLHLTMENNNSAYCYMITKLALNNFVARVEVSHLDGNLNSSYGIIIEDESRANRALFVINGGRKVGSTVSGGIQMETNSKIKGAAITVAGQKYYYIDTLEVVKKSGSDRYFFVVNQDTLDTLTGVNFPIAGVGFFCQDSVELTFDNFIASEGNAASCPTAISVAGKRVRAPYAISKNSYSRTYDILGRSVLSIKPGQLRKNGRDAVGVYVNGDVQEKNILFAK